MERRNRLDFISWIRLSGKGGTILFCLFLIPAALFASRADVLAELIRSGNGIPASFFLTFVQDGMQTDTMRFLFPLLCALPYAFRFGEDLRCGVIRLILARSSRQAYLRRTIAYGTVAGGLLVTAGMILAIGISFPVFFLINRGHGQSWLPGVWETVLPALIRTGFLYFSSGCLWTAVGMLCSVFSASLPAACLSPFIAYYLLIILYERYFSYREIFYSEIFYSEIFYGEILYPKAWIQPGESWPLGGWSAGIWALELAVLISFLFLRAAERRLSRV